MVKKFLSNNLRSMGKYKDTSQIMHLLDCCGFRILYKFLVNLEVLKEKEQLFENKISRNKTSQFHLIDNA